ncbi:MAG: hemin uptake protein HemP [Methanosarcinaceae archaeon]
MQAKTIVKINSDIFDNNVLITEGYHDFIVRFTYPKECGNGIPMTVELLEDNQMKASKVCMPGDDCVVKHTFKARSVKDLSESHVFPIIFKMSGQEYKLNRTKQNKLILTK